MIDLLFSWTLISIIILVSCLISNRRYRWFYILYKTLPRDILAGHNFANVNLTLWWWERNKETVPKLFRKLCMKHPDKIAFYFEDEKWTYQELNEFSNKVANYFKSEGYKKGDTVALYLENRPEYVGIWLGLSKIGVVTALINTNLLADPLFHSLSVANSKGIIFGTSLANAIEDISNEISGLKLYQFHEKTHPNVEVRKDSVNLRDAIEDCSDETPRDIEDSTSRDKLLYIYTSGTTGLPKAAVISNLRFIFMVVGLKNMLNLSESDVIYDPLPLYHSAGGMAGAGQSIIYGITVALRKKFSASNFWIDCRKYNCTVAQYIGEICRYLLATHKGGKIDHPVKKMLGNGLRPQIWEKFVDTFNVKIYEFYGATEGNSNLINIDNKVGAVGFVPRYASLIYPVTLVKCDEETGEPIRNKKGFCIRCEIGEPGVLIGQINPKRTVNDFSGYADKQATKKKVIENVFKKGDMYFNSGDVLMQDELGYYYFKDRTGDTFRWKGENVATSEVESVISNVIDLKDSIVYGVEIPGTEGRAGMMAILDVDDTLDKQQLCKGLKSNLPAYAVPIFLRVMKTVPLTGTFKLKKKDLLDEGFNPVKCEDKLYFYDANNLTYIPLTKEIYDDIMSGEIRL